MLKTSRIFQLFRQVPTTQEALLRASRRTELTGLRLPSKTTPQRRGLTTTTIRSARPALSSTWRASLFRRARQTRYNSTNPTGPKIDETKLSMSERMRAMSKKYGWTVVGIYLGLSAIDFPFCYLAVRWFGTERIAKVEHAIMDYFWTTLEKVAPGLMARRETKEALDAAEEATRDADAAVAEKAKHENASIWTQLLFAYGVHKSLIFIRVPLTVAITPKVVKTLRKWGYQIGKPKPK
ncbi:unnamed protein product [Zymoseptoria tritici ST99CH_3D1]|uniref:DUF1279 domain-containing protein n=2 Tax=Zymoseptoria tritici TaxID=1047171 RepID=A0A1X7S776_ZYMT9|nr:unnamed protein product [Zymoseptoria tritici ST99CH_3D7]SMR60740.1 unnamed protein product [Zymoseptoria tritici ST99CH_1E4]SMR63874.1 unnamed protein product [Zymoseptoria tritici ST99CH_3D1]